MTTENRLLCVMSNCHYIQKHVTKRLAERVSALGLCTLGQEYDDTLQQVEELDARCFVSLLQQKGALIMKLIQVHTRL